MAKKENNWIAWAALAIALVALISVLGNAYMTGEVIVKKSPTGTVDVYTKTEVNNMISKVNGGIIERFDTLMTIVSPLGERVDLTNNFPKDDVTISGKIYTIELISASDSAATVKVTDRDSVGVIDSVEIKEGSIRSFKGLFLYIAKANEQPFTGTDYEFAASVIVYPTKLSNYIDMVQLKNTMNSSRPGITNDKATFTNVATGDLLDTVWLSEGKGTLVVNGKSYGITMAGSSSMASEKRIVTVENSVAVEQQGKVGDFFFLM